MKTFFLSLALFIISLAAKAQIDSAKISISLSEQARDWVFVTPILDRETFDPLRDTLARRFRNNPGLTANTTVITLDSVERGEILYLHYYLRTAAYYYGGFLSRIDASVRALTDPYIVYHLSLIDAAINAEITDRMQTSLKRLKGQRN